MRTKQEHASEKHTLLRLFQNLEPTTLARVLEDVEHWDPKWFFEAFQTIVVPLSLPVIGLAVAMLKGGQL